MTFLVRGASPGCRHAADSASIHTALSGRLQSPEASTPQTIRLLVTVACHQSPDAELFVGGWLSVPADNEQASKSVE